MGQRRRASAAATSQPARPRQPLVPATAPAWRPCRSLYSWRPRTAGRCARSPGAPGIATLAPLPACWVRGCWCDRLLGAYCVVGVRSVQASGRGDAPAAGPRRDGGLGHASTAAVPSLPHTPPLMTGPRCAIVVFARLPVPGQVKTRLAKGVGADAARDWYAAAAELAIAQAAACSSWANCYVYHSSSDATADVECWLAGAGLVRRTSGAAQATLPAAANAALQMLGGSRPHGQLPTPARWFLPPRRPAARHSGQGASHTHARRGASRPRRQDAVRPARCDRPRWWI
jgi:hypothetical protein